MDGDTQQQSSDQNSVPIAATEDGTPSREALLYPDDQPAADTEHPNPPEHPKSPERRSEAQETPTGEEYQLQMPDGVQLDQELLSSAAPALREAGISNEQANKLLPLVGQVQERMLAQMNDEFTVVQQSWAKEAKADREIGGKNWSETSRLAGVALKAGGAAAATHEARQILNESGLGNHPAMIRLFRKMGAEIERLGGGKRGTSGGVWKDAAERHQRTVYPGDPPKG